MQKKLYHILYYVCNKKKCFLHNINVELVVIFYDFHLNNSTPPIISAIPMYLFQVNATFSLPIRPNASINAATKSCEINIIEIATVGLNLPIPSITVTVIIIPSTPPKR